MIKSSFQFIVILLNLSLFGCATIMNGDRQMVPIRTKPPGATVMINDSVYGTTPMNLKMKRSKAKRSVKLMLNGYQTYEMQMRRKLDVWVYGNILLGGLFGFLIDISTGAMYCISPNIIDVELIAEK